MKTKVQQILKYTDQDYQMLVMDLFVAWCSEHAHSNNHLQVLVSSNSLYNWFIQEYTKREEHFLYIAQPFLKRAHTGHLRQLYDDVVSKMKFYPKGILKKLFGDAKGNEKRSPAISYYRPNYTLN